MAPDPYRDAAERMVGWRSFATISLYAFIGSLLSLLLPAVSERNVAIFASCSALAFLFGHFMRLYWRGVCLRIHEEEESNHPHE